MNNLLNNRTEVINYISDHDAIKLKVTIECNEKINTISETQKGKFMFKRAQWDRFSKHISKKYNLRIPKKKEI